MQLTAIASIFLVSLFASPADAAPARISIAGPSVDVVVEIPGVDPDLVDLVSEGVDVLVRPGEHTGSPTAVDPRFAGDLLILPAGVEGLREADVYNPIHLQGRPGLAGPDLSYLNRVRAYFSTASGGFGLRIGYDRRLRPDLRMTAGTELLTYGYRKAVDLLGPLPDNVTRITLVHLPIGLQQQFGAGNRVVPFVGAAAGPVLRFDHRPGLAPGFYPTYTDLRTQGNGATFGVTVNPFEDFPSVSLTVGAFAEAGADIRLGSDRDVSMTLAGRYSLTRFPDALGNPGDFSGLSISVGFGKYF